MKHRLGTLILTLSLLGLTPSSWAMLQTHFQILGVSTNLTKMGIAETWIADGSGIPHCEARVYTRDRWEPEKTQTIPFQDDQQRFNRDCAAMLKGLTQEEDLHPIEWEQAEMSPAPLPIKDGSGKLLSDNPEAFSQNYPARQMYEFTLPPSDTWELLIRSADTPNPVKSAYAPPQQGQPAPSYSIVFRPKLEPIPYQVVQSAYTDGHFLYSPIKMMVNNHYGLLAIIMRDYQAGFEGFDYHYRPFFLKWPDYQPLSIEDSKAILNKAANYSLQPGTRNRTGENTMQEGYRAYLRLKAEGLPVDEIMGALEEASFAGKLYWMALLYDKDPASYRSVAADMLDRNMANVDVIQNTATGWQPSNFQELVRQQAKAFNISL